MRNVYITVYEDEYKAYTTMDKARAGAKARLEEIRACCSEKDETSIVEFKNETSLRIVKDDGRLVFLTVQVRKLAVE